MREITQDQARALAAFLATLRPDWDPPGIVAVLAYARTRAPVGELACAAVRAALDDGNRTPAVIDQPGRHWRHTGDDFRPQFERPPDARRCSVCSLGFNDCRAKWDGDHEFESVTDNRRQQTAAPEDLRAAMTGGET